MGRGSRSGGGSFGGGGRSSFGGGGRSSRSSFGGPSIGHRGSFGGHRHHHTIYIGGRRHHHHYYGGGGGSPLSALITVLIFFAIFFGLAGFGMSGNLAYDEESLEIAVEDYYYYQDMIDNAKEKGYTANGKVVNSYYDEEVGKYYIVYVLPGQNEPLETFSVYTRQEVSKYDQGSNIPLALGGPSINATTESIDMDFENIALEDFSLYIIAKDRVNSTKIVRTVFLGVAGVFVAIVVLIIVKNNKKSKANEVSSSTTTSPVSSSSTCKYCGTVHESGTKKCGNCGAQLK